MLDVSSFVSLLQDRIVEGMFQDRLELQAFSFWEDDDYVDRPSRRGLCVRWVIWLIADNNFLVFAAPLELPAECVRGPLTSGHAVVDRSVLDVAVLRHRATGAEVRLPDFVGAGLS
jgi:hypothetical protein